MSRHRVGGDGPKPRRVRHSLAERNPNALLDPEDEDGRELVSRALAASLRPEFFACDAYAEMHRHPEIDPRFQTGDMSRADRHVMERTLRALVEKKGFLSPEEWKSQDEREREREKQRRKREREKEAAEQPSTSAAPVEAVEELVPTTKTTAEGESDSDTDDEMFYAFHGFKPTSKEEAEAIRRKQEEEELVRYGPRDVAKPHDWSALISTHVGKPNDAYELLGDFRKKQMLGACNLVHTAIEQACMPLALARKKQKPTKPVTVSKWRSKMANVGAVNSDVRTVEPKDCIDGKARCVVFHEIPLLNVFLATVLCAATTAVKATDIHWDTTPLEWERYFYVLSTKAK